MILRSVNEPEYNTVSFNDISSCYISIDLLKIAEFMSEYYCCSLGEALALCIPYDNTLTCKHIELRVSDSISLSTQ